MTYITLPLKRSARIPANGVSHLADEILTKVRISEKKLPAKSRDLLSEILDYVVEAEQTIAAQKQHIEKLEVMTTTDPLTGLLNRRGIMVEVKHAIATADRHGEGAIFTYIDLDGFKQVNDEHGHAAGDKILTLVADILQRSIRQTDYAARLGGDEFALLLTHSDYEGGKSRSQFIQRQLNFRHLKFHGRKIPLRASFGIAEITPEVKLEDVLQHADQNMYRNKASRRKQA